MQVVRIDRAGAKRAAATLAAALFDDPLAAYLSTDVERRRAIIEPFMRANIELGLLYGEVFSTVAGEAAAVWLRPGHTTLGPVQLVRSGLLWATVRMGLGAMTRFFRFAALGDQLHRQSVSTPHWWLFLIGVDPSHQQQGLGRALLEPMLARADGEAVPCYLETTNGRNLAYYQRFGFAVTGQAQARASSLTVWSMLRRAAGAR